jgi:NADH-quinone oxidoreductase subunit J
MTPSVAAAERDRLVAEANPLSRAGEGEIGTMRGLGRSLFGDYLFAVELAGTLLLVGAVGAIAIAPRRSRGTL